ncbi:hypothetical protein GJ496_010784 [Pomphorhynchus laevis]|nr:hypothetical protein GJ496_010784 [Pomphorhynchus laevis]
MNPSFVYTPYQSDRNDIQVSNGDAVHSQLNTQYTHQTAVSNQQQLYSNVVPTQKHYLANQGNEYLPGYAQVQYKMQIQPSPYPNPHDQMSKFAAPANPQQPSPLVASNSYCDEAYLHQQGANNQSNGGAISDDLKIIDIQSIRNIWESQSSKSFDPILQCTLNCFPKNDDMLLKSRLPLGLIINPFPKSESNANVPRIKRDSLIRCVSCRTYLNPYVTIVRRHQWKCNICNAMNKANNLFYVDSNNEEQPLPELTTQTVEFLASSDYMIRPPTPAVYVYLLEISYTAVNSGYLDVVCNTLCNNLDNIPSDSRSLLSIICFDEFVHFFSIDEQNQSFKRLVVSDISEVFLPTLNSDLLFNLQENKTAILRLLSSLPKMFNPSIMYLSQKSCLGFALNSAITLLKSTGGRLSTFIFECPSVGPGNLEDANKHKTEEFQMTTDFYKELSIECSDVHICIDLFVLGSSKLDLFTLYSLCKSSAGELFHIPQFNVSNSSMLNRFTKAFTRYLTRPIGFEAVLRVRCSPGISSFSFFGNFLLKTADLLNLPVVNSDASFGIRFKIEEDLSCNREVYFQLALLYTNHKAERTIRVYTLAIPVADNINDLFRSVNVESSVALISKMAFDKVISDGRQLAREGMTNVVLDILKAFRSIMFSKSKASVQLYLPSTLASIPCYMLALMKSKGYNTDPSITNDQRSFFLFQTSFLSPSNLVRLIYPPLFNLVEVFGKTNSFLQGGNTNIEELFQQIKQLPLSHDSFTGSDVFLLLTVDVIYIYFRFDVHLKILQALFNTNSILELPERSVAKFSSNQNWILKSLILFLQYQTEGSVISPEIIVIRDASNTINVPAEISQFLYDEKSVNSSSLREFYIYLQSKM